MRYHDTLEALNENIPLKEKLVQTHKVIQQHFPFIARIAVSVYDPKTTLLKSYLHSSGDGDPLAHYQTTLDEAPSLKRILAEKLPRIINNSVTFNDGDQEHTRRMGRDGYSASYTMPMFYNGIFFGFIFFNADEKNVFSEEVLYELDVFGHLISLMIINELSTVSTLVAAVNTTTHITHQRDPETGSHLDRMSRYSRLIAISLADQYQLDDDFIEHVFMYAPLHDIGKIAIPDSILLKPGKLTDEETVIMKTHVDKGREIIDDLLSNFGLESMQHVDILRNIPQYHHEAVNGQGYPEGLQGEAIPLEARIVAVADVFDALTSERPYKKAWSNDEAFAALMRLAGSKLDRHCVNALIANRDEVEKIQQSFQEDPLG